MGKLFSQYRGLRRELYILFFGRVVTNMGALIWPMLTLILKNKLGLSASDAANFIIVMGFVQLPCTLIGGKLADRFSKKNIIICCDLITVVGFITCFFLPISFLQIGIFCLAGFFAHMEWPAYDALVADFTLTKDRERAYSLSYLGTNLGMVLAPMIGGLLFANYLNWAFLLSGIATFSSTILIFFFIKDTKPVHEEIAAGIYQEREDGNIFTVLRKNKLIFLFLICSGISSFIYVQFNFLLPLNMEQLYGENGAVLFGTLASVNAVVVIVATPMLTGGLSKLRETSKFIIGELLIAIGFSIYIFMQGIIPMYIISMVIFTLGEVVYVLGKQPYLSKRIPASHRGRIVSLVSVIATIAQGVAIKIAGIFADTTPMQLLWTGVVCVGLINVIIYILLRQKDKQNYPLLYK